MFEVKLAPISPLIHSSSFFKSCGVRAQSSASAGADLGEQHRRLRRVLAFLAFLRHHRIGQRRHAFRRRHLGRRRFGFFQGRRLRRGGQRAGHHREHPPPNRRKCFHDWEKYAPESAKRKPADQTARRTAMFHRGPILPAPGAVAAARRQPARRRLADGPNPHGQSPPPAPGSGAKTPPPTHPSAGFAPAIPLPPITKS